MALFVVAGFALLNNPEFGGPCLLATFFALLIGTPARVSRASAITLIGRLAAGVGAAAAVVTAMTLVRSGSLPNPELLTYYSRLFASQGFGLLPMPTLGFHLIVYVSFAGALVLAATPSPGRRERSRFVGPSRVRGMLRADRGDLLRGPLGSR